MPYLPTTSTDRST